MNQQSKEQIQKELESLHDIREESLFPDFVGFAYIQRADAPYLTPDARNISVEAQQAEDRKFSRHWTTGTIFGGYPKTKAIKLKSDYAEAYYFRGFTKAIELKSDYAEAYAFRGGIYNIQGDYDRAIQDSTKTIDLNPDYAEAYAIRGMAYCSQGDYGCAIQDLTKTIKIKPGLRRSSFQGPRHCLVTLDAYYPRGLAWLYLQKWKKAKSDLILAKNMGLDIVALFSQYTENVANSEQNTEIKLPKHIAAMLTESEN